MKKIVKKGRRSGKKLQRGSVGNFFVFGILALLIVLGIAAVGGPPSSTAPLTGTVVNIVTPTPDTTHKTLQLETFGFTTLAPTDVNVQQPTLPTKIIPTITLPQQSTPPPTSNLPVCPDEDDGVNEPTTCQCQAETLICISNTQYKILGKGGTILIDCSKGGSKCGSQTCGIGSFA